MFFGIVITPWTWLMLIVAVILSLVMPFAVVGSVTSFLPEPFNLIASNILAGIGFPVLLCYLHSRKMFGRGLGSVFFRLYTWFYLVLGLFSISFGFLAYDTPQVPGIIVGIIMLATGLGMVWWSRRTSGALQDALNQDAEQQAAFEREQQIQIQTEAIARAAAANQDPQ